MREFKDYTNKDCCINCEGFCFWDSDYCCFPQMKIHQYNIRYSKEAKQEDTIHNNIKTITSILRIKHPQKITVLYYNNTNIYFFMSTQFYLKYNKKVKKW